MVQDFPLKNMGILIPHPRAEECNLFIQKLRKNVTHQKPHILVNQRKGIHGVQIIRISKCFKMYPPFEAMFI